MAKGDLTRQKILAEAAEQASVRGLSAVSLSDVAEAVGLSKSGVFKHFQAKETLQQALMETVTERFTQQVWAPSQALPRGLARLDDIFGRWLSWVESEASAGGCGLMAFAVELDDQPGPLRDYLKAQQQLWHKTLSYEFAALRDPPLPRDVAGQAAFEMKSLVLGYNHSRRLLDDEGARAMTGAAFRSLLQRAAGASA